MRHHDMNSNKRINIMLFVFIFMILIPLSLPLGNIGEKPIDLTYSDLLIIITFFIFIFSKKISVKKEEKIILIFSFLVFIYMIFVGAIGSILQLGDILPIISSLNFSKHILFVFVAFVVFKKIKPSSEIVIQYLGKASVLIVGIIFASDIFFNPQFPASRWGGMFFYDETYGFPNSTSVFYSFYLTFIAILMFTSRKVFLIFFLLVIIAIIFFTFSRSGWVALIIVLISVLFYSSVKSKKSAFINMIFLIAAILVFTFFYEDLILIVEPWTYKLDTITGKNVTLSGRELIWYDAKELIYEKPFTGYFFHSFSNYVSGYDTPHQQYLEIIFKMGLLGFFVYLSFIFYLFSRFFKACLKSNSANNIVAIAMGSLTIAILVTNFAQPNFSFSLLGNAYVFIISLLYFTCLQEKVSYI